MNEQTRFGLTWMLIGIAGMWISTAPMAELPLNESMLIMAAILFVAYLICPGGSGGGGCGGCDGP